jgi:hypothetical protein
MPIRSATDTPLLGHFRPKKFREIGPWLEAEAE